MSTVNLDILLLSHSVFLLYKEVYDFECSLCIQLYIAYYRMICYVCTSRVSGGMEI